MIYKTEIKIAKDIEIAIDTSTVFADIFPFVTECICFDKTNTDGSQKVIINPIITPNTVLTDNLNGTIITYDGNEYSLQNDKGNYALQHCKLRPNYIPVGVKEYSDILYIVSYH